MENIYVNSQVHEVNYQSENIAIDDKKEWIGISGWMLEKIQLDIIHSRHSNFILEKNILE